MKWYKRDPEAFKNGVASLTLEEIGAYSLLCDFYYSRDGHVPDDDWFVARWIGCNPRTWRKIKISLFLKQKLRVNTEGELVPNRGEYTLNEAQKYSERQANRAGKRWERAENCNKNNAAIMPLDAMPSTTTSTTREERKSASRSTRSKPRTPFPEDWQPTNFDDDLEDFQRFADHARANGRLCADWQAAWRNWTRKSMQLKQKEATNGRGRSVLAACDKAADFFARGKAQSFSEILGLDQRPSETRVRRLPSR